MAKFNMTTGNIPGHLTRFAIPLVLGNMFQLTYNAFDSIIVGRVVGDEAQAAIGIANPLMNVLIFFIVGACNGVGVILSECFGAGEKERYRKELGTAVAFGTIFFVAAGVLFWMGAPAILGWIKTPPQIMDATVGYLRIVLLGLGFSYLYNVYAAAVRSTGNTSMPLLFLVLSSCLNIGLDILLVAGMKLGTQGAAIGTVIAQAFAAVFCIVFASFRLPLLRLTVREFRIEGGLLKKLLNYSVSTGLQQITLNVGKVLIQSFVNPLGVQAVAAFNAVNRIDDFVFQPEQSIASAVTTFVAQNRGAKQKERVRKCFWYGLVMEVIYWIVIGVVVFTQSGVLMRAFTADEGSLMVAIGAEYLKYMSFFYVMPAVTNWMQGYIRGFGRMNVCLAATFIQMIGRVGSAAFLIPRFGIVGAAYSCSLGWIVMLLFEMPYYLIHKKEF